MGQFDRISGRLDWLIGMTAITLALTFMILVMV
jgi:hypothetical protein